VGCDDLDGMNVDSQLDGTCRRSLFPIHDNRIPTVNTDLGSRGPLEQ
jgi:hypothetical protein